MVRSWWNICGWNLWSKGTDPTAVVGTALVVGVDGTLVIGAFGVTESMMSSETSKGVNLDFLLGQDAPNSDCGHTGGCGVRCSNVQHGEGHRL